MCFGGANSTVPRGGAHRRLSGGLSLRGKAQASASLQCSQHVEGSQSSWVDKILLGAWMDRGVQTWGWGTQYWEVGGEAGEGESGVSWQT